MNQWYSARRELFLQVQDRVRTLLGEDGVSFQSYRRSYENEFSKKWKKSHTQELISQIDQSKVIYLADFHALKQSQRSHLRILKKINRPMVLLVEFIESKKQIWLDQFQQGQLSEKEFLSQVEWDQSWGFPWEHYRTILEWARKNKVPVLGLNLLTQRRDGRSLLVRDRWAAKIINRSLDSESQALHVVIYGDLHLASAHLPKLVKCRKTVTLFQNSEKISFQILKQMKNLNLDLVRLSQKKFCVLNVLPWVKWQNYLMYLENQLVLEDEEHDHTDSIAHYVKILSHDLKMTVSVDHFSVYTPEDPHLWVRLTEVCSEKKLRWVRRLIEEEVSFYLPEGKIAFLARASVNHAAALAMAIVHSQISHLEEVPHRYPDDFLAMIWLEAVKYFGTKLINPKRKTDTFQDMKRSLTSQHSSERTREAIRIALAQKAQEVLFYSSRPQRIPFRKLSSVVQAAQLLGHLLGEKLFFGFQTQLIKNSSLRKLFKQDIQGPDFSSFYYEVVSLVESWPEPFTSKNEKL